MSCTTGVFFLSHSVNEGENGENELSCYQLCLLNPGSQDMQSYRFVEGIADSIQMCSGDVVVTEANSGT